MNTVSIFSCLEEPSLCLYIFDERSTTYIQLWKKYKITSLIKNTKEFLKKFENTTFFKKKIAIALKLRMEIVTTTRPKTDNYIGHICANIDEVVDTTISKHLLSYLKQILVVHNGTYRNVKLSNTMIREVIYLKI